MKNISVIGAGTMGNGIAHVFAQRGFLVSLIDLNQSALSRAKETIIKNLDRQVAKNVISDQLKDSTLSNLSLHTDLKSGLLKADLVIEAATETESVKLEIFRQIDELAPVSAILASNTSSISITKIAASTKRPQAVIGMHFMNPVPVMKLVEVINGYATSKDVCDTIVELARKLDKIPCVVKDYPGFIANRILMPMINEAICSIHEGIASVSDVDSIMKLGMAHPMGPLQLADFIGLDTCRSILEVLHSGFGNPKYAPCPLLINMVNAGYLGVKSGEGFYKYSAGTKELSVSSRFV